jgi:hypothetical protein
MVDQPGRGPAPPERHLQGVDNELGAHVIGHAPADDPPREHILDSGHLEPALPASEVGDVGDPDPSGSFGREGPIDKVLAHPDARNADRRSPPALGLQPDSPAARISRCDALAPDPLAVDDLQLGMADP